MDRDPQTGKFLPGNNASHGRGGRPKTEDVEKLRLGLSLILSNGSVRKWAEATRTRFERGDLAVTQFIFERIAGKVPNLADIPEDSNLADLLERLLHAADDQGE